MPPAKPNNVQAPNADQRGCRRTIENTVSLTYVSPRTTGRSAGPKRRLWILSHARESASQSGAFSDNRAVLSCRLRADRRATTTTSVKTVITASSPTWIHVAVFQDRKSTRLNSSHLG